MTRYWLMAIVLAGAAAAPPDPKPTAPAPGKPAPPPKAKPATPDTKPATPPAGKQAPPPVAKPGAAPAVKPPAPPAADPVPEDLTGAEVLQRCAEAYASLRTYTGTTTAKSRFVINGKLVEQTASARITFQRPGKIRIEGKDLSSNAFAIISDGSRTWTRWEPKGPAPASSPSVEKAVSQMTGIALSAPTTIPAALLNLQWGSPFGYMARSEVDGREPVDGSECYRVVADTLTGRLTRWIDCKTFLLRRVEEQVNLEHLTGSRPTAVPASKSKAAKPVPASSNALERAFTGEKINGAVDASAFDDPGKPKKLKPRQK